MWRAAYSCKNVVNAGHSPLGPAVPHKRTHGHSVPMLQEPPKGQREWTFKLKVTQGSQVPERESGDNNDLLSGVRRQCYQGLWNPHSEFYIDFFFFWECFHWLYKCIFIEVGFCFPVITSLPLLLMLIFSSKMILEKLVILRQTSPKVLIRVDYLNAGR